jgi:hypothetical protein
VNRLALVPLIVVAFYVALASYIAWPILVYELGQPRVRSNLPMNFPNREFRSDETNLPSKQTIAVASPYQVPKEPVRSNERPAAAVWVTVLLAAKVHTGPSIDTPISHFYPAGTSLHATHYYNDWIEIVDPGTLRSGWIYRKYLGAIDNSEQSKIASQQAQVQSPIAEMTIPGKRYAKATTVKRYANTSRSSKKSTRVIPAAMKPVRGRTEMASLLQRALSGY